jgi:hypothetical protein
MKSSPKRRMERSLKAKGPVAPEDNWNLVANPSNYID